VNCPCHDLPMYWERSTRYLAGGKWLCAETKRERERERYGSLDGVRYSRKLLLGRRRKALSRRAERHARLTLLRQEGV
jgi:hypothetical protein